VLVLAIAIFMQYRLANIPIPLHVDTDSAYSVMAAQLGSNEELVVTSPSPQTQNPVSGDSSKMLFSGTVPDYVALDVHFDLGRLSGQDLNLLKRNPPPNQPPLPSGQQIVDYSSAGPADGIVKTSKTNLPPCRTSVEGMPVGATMPNELHLFQSKRSGDDNYRYLELKADQELLVSLLTIGPSNDPDAPGCGKRLGIAAWTLPLSGPQKIGIVAAAGTVIRLAFTPFSREAPWKSKTDFEPFKLENSRLLAHALRRAGRIDNTTILSAMASDDDKGLVLKHLWLGADSVKLEFSGKAMVQKNGKYVETFDLVRFATSNPLVAGLLAMVDGALLEWLRRSVFRSPKQDSGEKRRRKKET